MQIRRLDDNDADTIAAAFTAQGWDKPAEQYRRYAVEQAEGLRVTLIAEVDEAFSGYLNVVWRSTYPGFRDAGIPEIADFNVLQRFQRRGIGTALMGAAEALIAERSRIAGIGVGLTSDYGPAQILYVKRGYVPDGYGLVYRDRPAPYGTAVTVDDDLVLYLTRSLR